MFGFLWDWNVVLVYFADYLFLLSADREMSEALWINVKCLHSIITYLVRVFFFLRETAHDDVYKYMFKGWWIKCILFTYNAIKCL